MLQSHAGAALAFPKQWRALKELRGKHSSPSAGWEAATCKGPGIPPGSPPEGKIQHEQRGYAQPSYGDCCFAVLYLLAGLDLVGGLFIFLLSDALLISEKNNQPVCSMLWNKEKIISILKRKHQSSNTARQSKERHSTRHLGDLYYIHSNNSTLQLLAEEFLPRQGPGSSPLFAMIAPEAQTPPGPGLRTRQAGFGGAPEVISTGHETSRGMDTEARPGGQSTFRPPQRRTTGPQKVAPTNVPHSYRNVSPATTR